VLAAGPLLVLAVRGPRTSSAAASSVDEVNVVPLVSTRPGNRAVTSWNSQPLPSGSLNEA
jgi:hypothetical protein